MAVADRVTQCVEHLRHADLENAFIQLSIAIDGTAKRQFPGQKTAVRCKAFLRDSLPFILWSLTNGTPTSCQDFTFQFRDSGSPSGDTGFEDVVYGAMRCTLLHEGSLPDNVTFTTDSCIEMRDGQLRFPEALIGALLFAVVSAPANAVEPAPSDLTFTFGTATLAAGDIWADREAMKAAVRNGFLYDVEAMLAAQQDSPGMSSPA